MEVLSTGHVQLLVRVCWVQGAVHGPLFVIFTFLHAWILEEHLGVMNIRAIVSYSALENTISLHLELCFKTIFKVLTSRWQGRENFSPWAIVPFMAVSLAVCILSSWAFLQNVDSSCFHHEYRFKFKELCAHADGLVSIHPYWAAS